MSRNTPPSPSAESPWSLRERLKILSWEFCWTILCQWTPKPANAWRILVLKAFGAQLAPRVFVHQRARITAPWRVSIGPRSAIGDRAHLYALGPISIGQDVTIAQESYLCTGTHDFNSIALPLLVRKITVEADAFIGLRAIILPGVTIGERVIVGAGAIVSKDVQADLIVAGIPAKTIGRRQLA
jgi:putative colanic acid biosynthesis acetyltransferase WcaF